LKLFIIYTLFGLGQALAEEFEPTVLVASLGASLDLACCDPGVVMVLGGALSQEASFLSAQEMLCQIGSGYSCRHIQNAV
jgi:hypothetical protein